MADLFSITAMFILFRETLEAAVVISVLLQLCTKMKMRQLQKWVWAGALLGVGVAIVIGTVFILLFFVAKRTIFAGPGQSIFYGFLMLLASFMLTFLAFAMLKVRGYEEKWRLKLEAATEGGGRVKGWWQMLLLAFTTTLREGIESVVFLTGVSAGLDPRSIPLAGVVGVVLGIAVGVALFYTGKSIADISWFIITMCVILFFISAGLTARSMSAFQAAGWFGYAGYPPSAVPWQNRPLWDWTGCCSTAGNKFFALMAALFGYTDTGTAIWLFAYFGYWLEILIVVAIRACKGSLLTALRPHPPQPDAQLALAKLGHMPPDSSSSSKAALPPMKQESLDLKVAPAPAREQGAQQVAGGKV